MPDDPGLLDRRHIIGSGLALLATGTAASVYYPDSPSRVLTGGKQWTAPPTDLPQHVDPQAALIFFTPGEAAIVAAAFARLIPADDLGPGAVEAGAVLFTDHQLAGPFGKGVTRYTAGPIVAGTPEQGEQSVLPPADVYRRGLPALDRLAHDRHDNGFAAIDPARQDAMLADLEAGHVQFGDLPGKRLFELLLSNAREGFLADPYYGGNRDMVGWRMIGFPGARYDYRDYVSRKGQDLNLEPVGIKGIA